MNSLKIPSTVAFSLNGREYHPPARQIAVICIDGCSDEYLNATLLAGRMPRLQATLSDGFRGVARGALPSFTNVNNSSIVTGLPPSGTGISGNFFLNPETNEEVMMNSAEFLRCETILAAAAKAGRKVGVVTAKEKLRDILAKNLAGIAFSAEKANQAEEHTHGISHVEQLVGPTPEIYSPQASLYVLQAGVALLETGKADFLYLSLTDYMQHKYAPEEEASLAFYQAMDHEFGRLLDAGAILGLTADHGMNAKNTLAGEPNVIYLETLLTENFGEGIKVICPITDPYVVHHGALGSFVCVHLPDPAKGDGIGQWILQQPGITEVYNRQTAALKLELPADRIGDLVVMCGRDVALGRRPADHDLSALAGGLRSHGGRYEEMVPFLFSGKLKPHYAARAAGDVRNFDIFEFTCNGVEP